MGREAEEGMGWEARGVAGWGACWEGGWGESGGVAVGGEKRELVVVLAAPSRATVLLLQGGMKTRHKRAWGHANTWKRQ